MRPLATHFFEANKTRERADAPFPRSRVSTGQPHRHPDVLRRREHGQQREGLEDERDVLAPQLQLLIPVHGGDLLASHPGPARSGPVKPGQNDFPGWQRS